MSGNVHPDSRPSSGASPPPASPPPCDVIETDRSLVVWIDLPHTKPADVHVEYDQGLLTVRTDNYKRELLVGPGLRAEQMLTEMIDGALKLTLPKAQVGKSGEIRIRIR